MESLTSYESVPKIVTTAPAIESLMEPQEGNSPWPEEIIHNPEVLRLAKERQELRESLDTLFDTVPDATLEVSRAIDIHLVDTEIATQTYIKLNQLLAAENTERLVLYLPFEILPDQHWKPATPELEAAVKAFTETYMNRWKEMLSIKDVRENFIHGDVLEQTSRESDHPRVVKALHIAPILVGKGLISAEEVASLLQHTEDPIFTNSVYDALAVLNDMGALRQPIEIKEPAMTGERSLPISESRQAWLANEQERQAIEEAAESMSVNIESNTISLAELEEKMLPLSPIENTLIGIHAIRKAIESTSRASVSEAQTLQKKYEQLFRDLWNKNEPAVHDAFISTWSRWSALGIIDKEYVDQFNIKLPKLDGSFSENKDRMSGDIEAAESLASTIESDPFLSQHAYPVALLYGSRVKGYNSRDADRDFAVFIKPETSEEDLEEVRKQLTTKTGNPVYTFKTTEDENGLRLAEKTNSTYVLFQSVWSGNQNIIKELHEKILVPYLYSSENKKLWTEEIERNIIQYRLLHRGYEMFFPPQGGVKTKHSDRIDSDSMFWDSGFRRMATKLYVSKVFLPHLEK